jgi:hypothetical protein
MARTRITGNTSRDRYCCVTSPRIAENTCLVIPTHSYVTSRGIRCIATIHARTRKKHFHSIAAWRVCWNVFTGLLPSNALSKSVAVSFSEINQITLGWVYSPHETCMNCCPRNVMTKGLRYKFTVEFFMLFFVTCIFHAPPTSRQSCNLHENTKTRTET